MHLLVPGWISIKVWNGKYLYNLHPPVLSRVTNTILVLATTKTARKVASSTPLISKRENVSTSTPAPTASGWVEEPASSGDVRWLPTPRYVALYCPLVNMVTEIISLSPAAMTHTGSIEFSKKKAYTTRMEKPCPRETASQLTTNTLARPGWTRATRAALCRSSLMGCNMDFAL